ncbi:hypothetical protein CFC21_100786 [Triticum aestivum]|uniref:Uncharacterized protein n=2 Tax=Triticum aestivum TaxID=4565 RepID=A0A9R1M1N8_WHEAT|nr:hypothetical protein CFC21_100783 [Triticum aestivum]KAF7099101.1 hypothetical protein CFC21_100786 [Triticum aestivum]
MENLISLVNKLQRACTALGDHDEESALPTLWHSLPSIAVVGGQSGSSASQYKWVYNYQMWFCVLTFELLWHTIEFGQIFSAGERCWKGFPTQGSGIVTRRTLVLQLHRIDEDREYAEFMHVPRKRFTDFGNSSILCLISKSYADDDIMIDA